jgi:hypothetical protein
LRGPLSNRAWTLQENMLFRRILRFAKGQVWWQCLKDQFSEVHPSDGPANERSWDVSTNFGFTRFSDTSNLAQRHEWWSVKSDPLTLWRRIVNQYAPRKITYPTDTFPAISGLAKEIDRRIGPGYKAASWQQDFVYGLLWPTPLSGAGRKKDPAVPNNSYIAPPWSWASVDFSMMISAGLREIYPSRLISDDMLDSVAEILEVDIVNTGHDPFGRISEGSVKIRGPNQTVCSCNIPPSFIDCRTPKSDQEVNLIRVSMGDYELGDTFYTDQIVHLPCMEGAHITHHPFEVLTHCVI